MPKLASYRRIITNDFKDPEQKKLIEQLSLPINYSFNELYFAANGRLGLKDNIYCTVKDVQIEKGIGSSFNLDKPGVVLGCTVISAINMTNSAVYPTSQPFVSFVQNGDSVIINNISGLQADQLWVIKIVAWLA